MTNTTMQEPQAGTLVRMPEADEEVTIDLLELLFVLRQKLVILVLFCVLGAVAAGAYTYFGITPEYEATSQLYISSTTSTSVIDLSSLNVATSLTADYQEMVLSRPTLQQVLDDLRLNEIMTVEELKDEITISNPTDTRILKITVRDRDPKLAMDIANDLKTVTQNKLPSIIESASPKSFEDAIYPEEDCNISYTRNCAIGGLAALMLCAAVIMVRYLSNDTIKSGADLEHYFGITPLATIPEGTELEKGKRKNKKKGRNRR